MAPSPRRAPAGIPAALDDSLGLLAGGRGAGERHHSGGQEPGGPPARQTGHVASAGHGPRVRDRTASSRQRAGPCPGTAPPRGSRLTRRIWLNRSAASGDIISAWPAVTSGPPWRPARPPPDPVANRLGGR